AACRQMRRVHGLRIAHAHLRYLNPFPANLGEVLAAYDQVLIPEMNLGQLRMLVRSRYLVDAVGYNQVRGQPFKAEELADAIVGLLDEGVGK
ncbi:MAG TPA: 2-oxoglutarate ferredoxin oxidoreductase subunit alpha, partial [Actinomycetes bacterium]|nr:2-oxoglutarate ferredoxin oxidoreductase subunit alpha [Actinomycetes bacterium]